MHIHFKRLHNVHLFGLKTFNPPLRASGLLYLSSGISRLLYCRYLGVICEYCNEDLFLTKAFLFLIITYGFTCCSGVI